MKKASSPSTPPHPPPQKKGKQENKYVSLNFTSILCLGYCQVSQTTFDILCFWLSDTKMSLRGGGGREGT